MMIGYMRNYLKPTHMAELTAMICRFKGIELVYFRHRDVDMKNEKVNGKILLNNKWVNVRVDIPRVIDISPFCYRHEKVVNYLNKHSFLTDNLKNRVSKEKLQELLAEDEKFSGHVIPTIKLTSHNDLIDFLATHKEIVVKPVFSRRGRGVYAIKEAGKGYIVGHQKEEIKLSKQDLKKLHDEVFNEKQHIAQKYIVSRTKYGDPFDCRIHLEKNGEGQWEIIKIIARTGTGQKVIANVNYGGGRSDIEPFLEANYGNEWETIHKELKKFGILMAEKMETVRKTELMTLGLDVGIDDKGNLFIFEANSAPGTAVIKSEVAMTRSDYYRYLLKEKAI